MFDTNIATQLKPIFISVYLSNSSFTLTTLTRKLRNASFVRLPRNCLKNICKMISSKGILLLDLGYNYLKKIVHNCFASLWVLENLHIDNNYYIKIY